MSKENLDLSRAGENAAVVFLGSKRYKIIERNYRDRSGEVDIIALDKEKDTICFIEVKTRQSDRFGLPEEAVDSRKQKKISRTALLYLKEKKLLDKKARFDVVSVNYQEETPSLNLIKDAFELDPAFTY